MSENNKDFEKEYDSMKDVIEFQNNMFANCNSKLKQN